MFAQRVGLCLAIALLGCSDGPASKTPRQTSAAETLATQLDQYTERADSILARLKGAGLGLVGKRRGIPMIQKMARYVELKSAALSKEGETILTALGAHLPRCQPYFEQLTNHLSDERVTAAVAKAAPAQPEGGSCDAECRARRAETNGAKPESVHRRDVDFEIFHGDTILKALHLAGASPTEQETCKVASVIVTGPLKASVMAKLGLGKASQINAARQALMDAQEAANAVKTKIARGGLRAPIGAAKSQ